MRKNICKPQNQQGPHLQNMQHAGASEHQTHNPRRKWAKDQYGYIFQGGIRDGHEASDKMLDITNYSRKANQESTEGSPHTGQQVHHELELKRVRAAKGRGQGSPPTLSWGCEQIQELWKIAWSFPKK